MSLRLIVISTCLLTPASGIVSAATSALPAAYPEATRTDHVDEYHGTKVADPYRWMEDIDSSATRAWVESEGKLSRDFLSAIPGRDAIAEHLRKIWNFAR